MKQWWTLLVKEAKDSQGILTFLLGATVALGLYAHLRGISDGHPSGALGLRALPYATVFILPPVLLHSFAGEIQMAYIALGIVVSIFSPLEGVLRTLGKCRGSDEESECSKH